MQSMIKISASYIIQSNQISSAYQAKTALNMSEKILKDYLVDHPHEYPKKVELSSSAGHVVLLKNTSDTYEAKITQENGRQFTKIIEIEEIELLEEPVESEVEVPDPDILAPGQKENTIED